MLMLRSIGWHGPTMEITYPTDGTKLTVSNGDTSCTNALATTKPYMAPVSAWFSTHYGPEVSYSKNWVLSSGSLWFDRWTDILTFSPQYLEIIT